MRRPSRLLTLVAIVVVTALLATGCGSTGGSSTNTPATSNPSIVIKNCMFAPMSLTVAPGTTITVRNEDTAPHTVTASGKAFKTGDIAGGATAMFTAPNKPGTYPYICDIHQYMQGTLTVK